MTVYEQCYATYSDNLNQVVQCVAEWAETKQNATFANTQSIQLADADEFRRWLLILCGALVFFMQTGFAMICAGCVRKKNMANTMLKNLLDVCGAALAFYATGYAFAYGSRENTHSTSTSDRTSFLGSANFFLSGNNIEPAFFFFQFAFSATSTTIVAGTLAERCRMGAYLCFSLVLSGFVYPVVAHNIWSESGLFSVSNRNALLETAMIDFSGSGVVHLTGGLSALYATCILGPRQGRFYDRRGNKLAKPGLQTGSSVALQMLGTMMLIFGWIGFNPGSALLLPTAAGTNKGFIAGHAAVTTVLAAAAGTLSSLLINGLLSYRRTGEFDFDVYVAMNGCLTGLVSITGGCGIVNFWAALIIGAVGGLVYLLSARFLIYRMIDDAVEAIPVHLAGGMWGVLAVGLFANPSLVRVAYGSDLEHFGWFFNLSDPALLGSQVLEVLFITGWVTLTMFPLFGYLNYVGWFRVNALEEYVGLDTTYMTTEIMNEENSDSNEEDRLAAYRQRFAERKQNRGGKNEVDSHSIPVDEECSPEEKRRASLNFRR